MRPDVGIDLQYNYIFFTKQTHFYVNQNIISQEAIIEPGTVIQ